MFFLLWRCCRNPRRKIWCCLQHCSSSGVKIFNCRMFMLHRNMNIWKCLLFEIYQAGLKAGKWIMFISNEFSLGSLMKAPLLSHVRRFLMSLYQPSLTRLLRVLWSFINWLFVTYPLLLPNSITFLTCGIYPGSIMDLFLQLRRGKNRKIVFSSPYLFILGESGWGWGNLVHEISHIWSLFIKPFTQWENVQERSILLIFYSALFYSWWQTLMR